MTDPTEPDEATRAWARALFADPDAPPAPAPDEPPDRTRGNVAPTEGANPTPTPTADQSMRDFTRNLFGYPLD